ncbi:holo-[acyl-carrier-protein] synthase [Rickettsiales endosymbiont of Peranema trichophorum]|uniref:holo-ACP synthase n=1 Tax=Rickettsiales endosymbiont of Peranema trichophorum TaxID=2486577 RepID=UPI001022C6F5|nr:holo-ACP synthase [Rickettsiales endosymbiont of Peranema trichophorum]RZI47312.1 holo-[acyl-carrier-protein] synthase [Rickettsiales endosymbiont of Peranema trichophorum]
MIKGIGCDIIAISRVDKVLRRFQDKFLTRVFTKEEIALGSALPMPKRIAHFAKRFAAKEAIAKALGYGIGSSFGFKDCMILNAQSGAPYVVFDPIRDLYQVHLSISDEKDYAIAYVVIEE